MYKSVEYAFTLTLKQHMYRLNPEVQYDQTYLHVIAALRSLTSTVSVVMELNKNFNVHYHGKIVFHKKSRSHEFDFKNKFRNDKFIGYVDIRQITDSLGWKEYMEKELTKNRLLVGRPAILYDEFALFEILSEFDIQNFVKDIQK